MGDKDRAVVAFHDRSYREGMARRIENMGYEVVQAANKSLMLKYMGIKSGPEAFKKNLFKLCLMDLNLDDKFGDSCESACEIFRYMELYWERNEIIFIAASSNPNCVKEGKKGGIPCVGKYDIQDIEKLKHLIKFYKQYREKGDYTPNLGDMLQV